jgi:hypothetical protein
MEMGVCGWTLCWNLLTPVLHHLDFAIGSLRIRMQELAAQRKLEPAACKSLLADVYIAIDRVHMVRNIPRKTFHV